MTLDQIRRAHMLRGEGRFHETPLVQPATLGRVLGASAPVHLKLELLQRTGSFKVRGATARIHALTPSERRRGVITASAGNHAQGVALAARAMGVRARVVMPERAPLAKRDATIGYGAEVVLHGADYDAAYLRALELQAEDGGTFVHAFDDDLVMAGQGTIGLEILERLPDVETVVCPVGGGGLIAGVAVALKSARKDIRVIGVQSAGADSAVRSFHAGHPVACERVETIADGIKVGRVGERTLETILRNVDAMVTVDDVAICRALLMLDEHAHLSVEPAGAAPVAALLDGALAADIGRDGPVVAIVSGGNMDTFERTRLVGRALAAERRHLPIRVELPDRRGTSPLQMAGLFRVLAEHDVNVLDVCSRRGGGDLPLGVVALELLVETRGDDASDAVIASLARAGLRVG